MKKNLRYILRVSAASLMLLLFVGYYVDINFFVHSHIINGVTIVHSHVHNKHHHDTDEGGHSRAEITLIANMAGQFLTTGATPISDVWADSILIRTIGVEQSARAVSHHLINLSLRAPPMKISAADAAFNVV